MQGKPAVTFQIQLPDKTDVAHFVQRLIHYLEPVPQLLLLPLVFNSSISLLAIPCRLVSFATDKAKIR